MLEALTINKAVMTDKAYRHAFGRPVEQIERSIIRAMHAVRFHFNFVTASNLAAAVSVEMGDCSKPTAITKIGEAAKKGLLVYKKDPENETRKLYRFAQGIIEKLRLIDELEAQIAEVITAQRADPTSMIAGEELLSVPIYFNIAAEDTNKLIRKNIEDREREFRSAKEKKRNPEHAT